MRNLFCGAGLALAATVLAPTDRAEAACSGAYGGSLTCDTRSDLVQVVDSAVFGLVWDALRLFDLRTITYDQQWFTDGTASGGLTFTAPGANAARYDVSYGARFRSVNGFDDIFKVRVRGLIDILDAAGSLLAERCLNGNQSCLPFDPGDDTHGWLVAFVNTETGQLGTTLDSVLPAPAPIAGAGLPLVLAGAGWLGWRRRAAA